MTLKKELKWDRVSRRLAKHNVNKTLKRFLPRELYHLRDLSFLPWSHASYVVHLCSHKGEIYTSDFLISESDQNPLVDNKKQTSCENGDAFVLSSAESASLENRSIILCPEKTNSSHPLLCENLKCSLPTYPSHDPLCSSFRRPSDVTCSIAQSITLSHLSRHWLMIFVTPQSPKDVRFLFEARGHAPSPPGS